MNRRTRPRVVASAKTLPRSVQRSLERLAQDQTHGATFLGTRALAITVRLLRSERRMDPKILGGTTRALAHGLRACQPAMGSFLHWADELDRLVRDGPDLAKRQEQWIRGASSRWRTEGARAVTMAVRAFPPAARVLTLSRSETVLKTLLALRGASIPRRIVVLRSLPGGEGARLSRELVWNNLEAILVEDHEATSAVRDSDLVITGADAIYRDGSLVHKTGTRSVALAAARSKVPFMVISGLSKAVGRSPPRHPLPPLFDLTPARLIRGFWTDAGFLRPREIARRISGKAP